jgi:hypothetical protein
MDTEDVAEELEISAVTVIRILRTQVGLHQAWKQARFDRARTKSRGVWQRVVAENPRLGVKAVRTLEPAAYAWLYKHDRSWLDLQSSLLQQAPPSNYARTNWDQRDVALAASIQEAVLGIASEQPGKVVMLWKIYQRLPELKSKLNQLDRLPLSKKALELGTQKKAAGQLTKLGLKPLSSSCKMIEHFQSNAAGTMPKESEKPLQLRSRLTAWSPVY